MELKELLSSKDRTFWKRTDDDKDDNDDDYGDVDDVVGNHDEYPREWVYSAMMCLIVMMMMMIMMMNMMMMMIMMMNMMMMMIMIMMILMNTHVSGCTVRCGGGIGVSLGEQSKSIS